MIPKTRISIVDYGMCNIHSVVRAFEHCGAETELIDSVATIEQASGLVLPGVGAFKDGMRALEQKGLIEAIHRYATTGKPFLGICLGMQMLLEASHEFGHHKGLGLIEGEVVRIPATGGNGLLHKVPHVGWSPLSKPKDKGDPWKGTILQGLDEGAMMYFVHSFTPVPKYPQYRLADTHYHGRALSAVIRHGQVYGTQFHPEKSGRAGLKIIENFIALVAGGAQLDYETHKNTTAS